MKVEVLIAPMHGPNDPPPIAITFKQGTNTLIRVELKPEDFALALTGRLVHGTVTKGQIIEDQPSLVLSAQEQLALLEIERRSSIRNGDLGIALLDHRIAIPDERTYELGRRTAQALHQRGLVRNRGYNLGWEITEDGTKRAEEIRAAREHP
jgi:hypothetical protein